MTAYTIIKNGGAAVDMSGLALAFTGLELVNMQPDGVNLSWTRRSVSELCPLAHNDTVEIFSGERRLFRGRARIGTLTSDGASIRIIGPWSHLDEQIYQLSLAPGFVGMPNGKIIGETYNEVSGAGTSLWTGSGYTLTDATHTRTWTLGHHDRYNGYTPPASTDPTSTGIRDVNKKWASRCWLFRPGGTPGQVYTTIQDEWARVMAYVDKVNATNPFDIGTVELGGVLAPRTRTIVDQPVSEVIRQVLAMKPDAAVWWDYSGSAAASINVRVASLEAPLELVIGEQVLMSYQLKVLDDLVPTGVVVRWEDGGSNSTGLGLPLYTDRFPGMEVASVVFTQGSTSLSVPGGNAHIPVGAKIEGGWASEGAVVSAKPTATTITMSQAAYAGGSVAPGTTLTWPRCVFRDDEGAVTYDPGVILHTVTDDLEWVPGIAKEVYNSLAVRRATGSLTVMDRDFSLGLRPGRVITLTGDPQLVGVQLWVQSVSWNPLSGAAQVTVGYPAHLQLRDRVDLKGWFKVSFTGVFGEVSSWIVPPPGP